MSDEPHKNGSGKLEMRIWLWKSWCRVEMQATQCAINFFLVAPSGKSPGRRMY